MVAEEKIKKARMNIFIKHPFYSFFLIEANITYNSLCSTACTNGAYIDFNVNFLDSLTLEETTGLLLHEVLHIVFSHHLRRNERHPGRWNKAADYVINLIIKESGHTLPKGGLIDYKYVNMSTEEVYELLEDEDYKGVGEVYDGDFNSEDEKNKKQKSLNESLVRASIINQGNVPLGVSRLIEEVLSPSLPWRMLLASYLIDKMKDDYSWKKPNRRYTHCYLPSIETVDTIKGVAVFIDTSGSINNEMINDFVKEVKEILSTFKKDIEVLYVDEVLQGIDTVRYDEEIKLNIKGGGGTNYRPGFEWAKDKDIGLALYFTDGYCSNFPSPPDFDTIWIINSKKDFSPPFGEIIKTIC